MHAFGDACDLQIILYFSLHRLIQLRLILGEIYKDEHYWAENTRLKYPVSEENP